VPEDIKLKYTFNLSLTLLSVSLILVSIIYLVLAELAGSGNVELVLKASDWEMYMHWCAGAAIFFLISTVGSYIGLIAESKSAEKLKPYLTIPLAIVSLVGVMILFLVLFMIFIETKSWV